MSEYRHHLSERPISPYHEAIIWIYRRSGTSSAESLAKLVLSLSNEHCTFSFRECIVGLDKPLIDIALRLVTHFAEHGEDFDLREAGWALRQVYPHLWTAGRAADTAKRQPRVRGRRSTV